MGERDGSDEGRERGTGAVRGGNGVREEMEQERWEDGTGLRRRWNRNDEGRGGDGMMRWNTGLRRWNRSDEGMGRDGMMRRWNRVEEEVEQEQ